MSTHACAPDCHLCVCVEDGCDDQSWSLGRCQRHYQRLQYWRDPEKARARRRARYARQRARRLQGAA